MEQKTGEITVNKDEPDELIEIFNGNTGQEGEKDGVADKDSSNTDEGEQSEKKEGEIKKEGSEKDAWKGEKEGQENGKTDEEEDGKKEEENTTGESNEEINDSSTNNDSAFQEEIAQLRASLRAQKQELALLKAKSVETEEDEDGNRIPTQVEKLAESLKETFSKGEKMFSLQADVLRNNPNFSDLDIVCSEDNWDTIVDSVAETAAKEQGIDIIEARLQTENYIWNQENPYKFMYGIIKEYHPEYAGKENTGGKSSEEGKKNVAKSSSKQKEHKAPGSVANVSSSAAGKSGWTAEKIDNLPESELSAVPADVYDLYMKDELD